MELERYKKMYACLCAAASRSIDLLDRPDNIPYVKTVLQQALWEAEEMYVSDEEEKIGIDALS